MKGIYKIICTTTNVIYIGSTTVDFIKRFRKHKQRLRHNYHENQYLQNAWNKYGEENFTFEIIEDLTKDCSEKIKERESFWLSIYFPKGRDFCFNMSDHTNGGNTINSEEAKIKFSESIKNSYTPELRKIRSESGKLRKDEIKETFKKAKSTDKWKQAHLEGVRKLAKDPKWLFTMKEVNKHRQIKVCTDRGEIFESVTEAAKQTGAKRANIRACINKKIKTSMNRKWFYYTDINDIIKKDEDSN